MGLMLPPRLRASSSAPMLMKRPFRVVHECADCSHESSTDIPMVDETDGAATVNDFIASGALSQLEFQCPRCKCESVVISNVSYIRQPTDGPQT
jgi:hypothetical protein